MAEQDPREGNNPEADERPEWLPENFKSPEDLARSYQEAQNKIREQGTQLNAMNENYTALAAQIEELQAVNQQPVQQQQYGIEQLREAMETDPLGTVAFLAQQAADQRVAAFEQQINQRLQPSQAAQQELVASFAEQFVGNKHEDWDEIKDNVLQFIADEMPVPDINDPRWADPRFVADVYDKGAALYKLSNGVLTPSTQDNREMKLAAQTATGGGSRPETPDEAKAAWERIAGAGGGSYADLASR